VSQFSPAETIFLVHNIKIIILILRSSTFSIFICGSESHMKSCSIKILIPGKAKGGKTYFPYGIGHIVGRRKYIEHRITLGFKSAQQIILIINLAIMAVVDFLIVVRALIKRKQNIANKYIVRVFFKIRRPGQPPYVFYFFV
jgi:hypothetical protein